MRIFTKKSFIQVNYKQLIHTMINVKRVLDDYCVTNKSVVVPCEQLLTEEIRDVVYNSL